MSSGSAFISSVTPGKKKSGSGCVQLTTEAQEARAAVWSAHRRRRGQLTESLHMEHGPTISPHPSSKDSSTQESSHTPRSKKKKKKKDLPVVGNLPTNAGDAGSIPGPGRYHRPKGKELHLNQWAYALEPCSAKSSPAATETQHSQK